MSVERLREAARIVLTACWSATSSLETQVLGTPGDYPASWRIQIAESFAALRALSAALLPDAGKAYGERDARITLLLMQVGRQMHDGYMHDGHGCDYGVCDVEPCPTIRAAMGALEGG